MARKHAFLISIAVALALVAGVYAAMQTTELGASASSSPEVSDAQIRQRDRQLDRMAQKIREHRKKRPPAVPALVASSSSAGAQASSGGSASSGPGPGAQVLVSNSGRGSTGSGHSHDDGREDVLEDRADEREDRLDDAADGAEDRADEREDARGDAGDDD